MILATGPTGSGKTTTLYAALGLRERSLEKIITVEDPVEYQLHGVTQVPVHRESGTTFATALRSILRQDPDVLMIGEMRDAETAALAIQAAMTGHMVLSTLHTNDSLSAIPRLFDLGVAPYLVAATLECILAQRLVRAVCADCAEPYVPSDDVLAPFDGLRTVSPEFRRGAGCRRCRGTGYHGRIGVFELAVMTDELRAAAARGEPLAVLTDIAARAGMRSLKADGWQKAQSGITTVEEVLRVCEA
jgi:general secretion pathway protein E